MTDLDERIEALRKHGEWETFREFQDGVRDALTIIDELKRERDEAIAEKVRRIAKAAILEGRIAELERAEHIARRSCEAYRMQVAELERERDEYKSEGLKLADIADKSDRETSARIAELERERDEARAEPHYEIVTGDRVAELESEREKDREAMNSADETMAGLCECDEKHGCATCDAFSPVRARLEEGKL